MVNQEALPHSNEWVIACDRYMPLLLNALSRLAKEGYSCPLGDGLDLIHDFFMTQWSGIVSRFDPERVPPVSFEAYLYRAFVLFARRRIIRLNRWRSSLMDTAWIANAVENRIRRPQEEAAVEEEQTAVRRKHLEAVRVALFRLPANSRNILLSYLEGKANSERQLATKLELSRYRVRELLVEAFGAILVAVGEQGQFNDREWEIANALSKNGGDLLAAARELTMLPAEVRRTRARILNRMSTALQRLRTTASRKGRIQMSTKETSLTAEDLLLTVFAEPSNRDALEALGARSREVLEFLTDQDTHPTSCRLSAIEATPDALAAVYEALGGAVKWVDSDRDTLKKLVEIKDDDDREVGNAFKTGFWAAVRQHPELVDLKKWFSNARHTGPLNKERQSVFNVLRTQLDVQAAWPECEPFVKLGIRPLTVFYATEAMMSVTLANHEVSPGRQFEFAMTPQAKPSATCQFICYDDVVDEIVSMTETDRLLAEPLWHWLGQLCKTALPFVFGGFVKTSCLRERNDVIQLNALQERLSLLEQWTSDPSLTESDSAHSIHAEVNKAPVNRKATKKKSGKKGHAIPAADSVGVSSRQVSSGLQAHSYSETRRIRPSASTGSRTNVPLTDVSLEQLFEAKALVAKLGSVEAAKKAIEKPTDISLEHLLAAKARTTPGDVEAVRKALEVLAKLI